MNRDAVTRRFRAVQLHLSQASCQMEQTCLILLLCALDFSAGFVLTKCCPEGYRVVHNYGLSNPEEFRAGNLHCKRDEEYVSFIIPQAFQVRPEEVFYPEIEDNVFFSKCQTFDFTKYNLRELQELNVSASGGLKFLVELSAGGSESMELHAGEYCADQDFYEGYNVLMACACPQSNCVQYCCGEHGKFAYLDSNLGLACNSSGSLPQEWDLDEARHLAPSLRWIAIGERFWRHRCHYSSSDFEVQEDAGSFNPVVVLKYHPVRATDHVVIGEDASLVHDRRRISSELYCVAPAVEGGRLVTRAFFCDTSEFAVGTSDVIFQSGFAGVGAMFSLLTLLVHALVSELRRGVKGVSLMAHCACMLLAYTAQAVRPLLWSVEGTRCLQLAYVLQFALLSAFFWLNVRAIFIFARFRSLETMLSRLSSKGHSPWLYPLCALYAAGLPALLCLATWWAQRFSPPAAAVVWGAGLALAGQRELEAPPWLITPDLDDTTCWFGTPLGRSLYFSLPMGLGLLANLAMFVATVSRLMTLTKGATLTCKDDLRSDRKRLKLFAKMFVLMGLTWSGEFVSFANYMSEYYWYLSTAAMTLRAAAVFFLFCFKRKVWESVKERYLGRCFSSRVKYEENQMNEFTSTKGTLH